MLSYLLLFNKHLEFDFFNSIQNSHVPEPGKLVENLQHLHITRGSQWGVGFYGYRLKFWLFYGYRLIFFSYG